MKQILSIKGLGLLLSLAIGGYNAQAQAVINTVYTNGVGNLIGTLDATPPSYPQFITFTVTNTNCYPITVTDFNMFHADSLRVNFGNPPQPKDVSNNGAIYTILRQTNGAIASDPATGQAIATWPIVGTSNPITTASNGIVPVLSGLPTNNLTEIAPNQEVRFAIVANDTFFVAGTIGNAVVPPIIPSPRTFTLNGVTLLSVDPTDYTPARVRYGRYPDFSFPHQAPIPANPNLQAYHYGFNGGVAFKRSGPSVTVVNNGACDQSGDSITLIPVVPPCVTGATIKWTGPGLVGTVTDSVIKVAALLANAGKYYVTYTANDETSAPTEVEVFVTPRAPKPAITTKTEYCIGEPFQPVVVTGQNILWYTTPTGGTGTTVEPYVNTNMAGSYTWYASQTVNNCEGDREPVTITVAPIPAKPTVTTPVVYCENDPAEPLTAGGQGLIWYVDPVGGLGSVIAPVPGTSVQDTLTWFVSQKVDGCEGPRSKLDVIVTFKPNGMILVSDTPWICQHEELTFTYYGSANDMTGITWNVPHPYATSVNGGIGLDPITIRFDSAGLQKVTMAANNLGCVGPTYTQYVTVNPIPTASIAAPADVCLGDDRVISLYDYTPTIDTFNWNWDGGITTHYATDQGPYGVYWTEPGVKVITLDIVDELCHGLATDTVIVRELPDARIKASLKNRNGEFDVKSGTICSGDSLYLEPGTIVSSSAYEWSPARFFDNGANIPVTYGRIDFTGIVSLKVTDDLGCVATDSIKVTTEPCCKIDFPNAFTPNNDGRNDMFRSITRGYQETRSFRVVNRWGQTVYESVDAQRGWDGTMRGEPADMGTYHYHIRFKCDGKWTDQSGEFILVR